VHLAKVERPEIGEERFIDQVIINAEIEGMRARLWWVLIRDPVEAIRYYLKGLVIHDYSYITEVRVD
jgi:hypothetical protein